MGVNILVVDDEREVLDSLRRVFSSLGSPTWNTVFASSGSDALAQLVAGPIDLIIADMRMPAMDGATLLTIVTERWPHISRFVLSGDANQGQGIRAAVGAVHQFLTKPCPPKMLMAAVREIEQLSSGEEAAAIREVVSAVPRLPVLPTVFLALRAALGATNSPSRVVSEVIRQDPSIAAKILQLANSAFFFRGAATTDVQIAVSRLGVALISRLLLVEGLMTGIVTDHAYIREVRRFFEASLVAEASTPPPHRDDAALAVLLCPIGRGLMIAADPVRAARAMAIHESEGIALGSAERRVFGTSHAAVGGYLIALWGLPLAISSAVRLQHRPETLQAGDTIHVATLHANGLP